MLTEGTKKYAVGTKGQPIHTASYEHDTPEEAVKSWLERYGSSRVRDDLREGLAAEGDAMGHCVGGYCDDVLHNGTRIYSLRDAKGQPHVTIETKPGRTLDEWLGGMPEDLYEAHLNRFEEKMGPDWKWPEVRGAAPEWGEYVKALPGAPKEAAQIVQIKGKQNAAPAEKYLPMVQDFVKSRDWERVGDLRNTGLLSYDAGLPEKYKHLVSQAKPGYYTDAELLKHLTDIGVDPEDADAFAEAYRRTGRRYAHGGAVRADEPEAPGFLPRTFEDLANYAERLYAHAA
jgi:hypothetical protein